MLVAAIVFYPSSSMKTSGEMIFYTLTFIDSSQMIIESEKYKAISI